MTTKRYQICLFSLLSLIYMLPSLQGVVMTVVAKDIMGALSLSPKEMGLLGAAYLYAYAVSMFFSGMLSALLGPRRTLGCMFLIAGIGGLITHIASTFLLACVGRALTGVGTAVVLTSSLTLFSRWFKAEQYSSLCAVFFSIAGLGALIGAWPLAVVTAALGWRTTFLLIASVTLLYALLLGIVVRDWPTPEAEAEIGVVAAPRTPITLGMMSAGLRKILAHRDFWKLCLWFVGMSGVYLSFVGLWAVPYFIDVHGFSPATAGLVVSMFAFGFILGNPLLSFLCDRVFHSNRIGLGGAGVLGFLAMLPLYLKGAGLGLAACIGIALVLGMALNAPNAVIYSSARNVLGSRLASIASGVLACMCFISGGLFQVVCGALLDAGRGWGLDMQQSYLLAFAPYVFCYALAAWAGFSLSRASDPGSISPLSVRATARKE